MILMCQLLKILCVQPDDQISFLEFPRFIVPAAFWALIHDLIGLELFATVATDIGKTHMHLIRSLPDLIPDDPDTKRAVGSVFRFHDGPFLIPNAYLTRPTSLLKASMSSSIFAAMAGSCFQ